MDIPSEDNSNTNKLECDKRCNQRWNKEKENHTPVDYFFFVFFFYQQVLAMRYFVTINTLNDGRSAARGGTTTDKDTTKFSPGAGQAGIYSDYMELGKRGKQYA